MRKAFYVNVSEIFEKMDFSDLESTILYDLAFGREARWDSLTRFTLVNADAALRDIMRAIREVKQEETEEARETLYLTDEEYMEIFRHEVGFEAYVNISG